MNCIFLCNCTFQVKLFRKINDDGQQIEVGKYYAHARAKVGGGRKEKYVWADLQAHARMSSAVYST